MSLGLELGGPPPNTHPLHDTTTRTPKRMTRTTPPSPTKEHDSKHVRHSLSIHTSRPEGGAETTRPQQARENSITTPIKEQISLLPSQPSCGRGAAPCDWGQHLGMRLRGLVKHPCHFLPARRMSPRARDDDAFSVVEHRRHRHRTRRRTYKYSR